MNYSRFINALSAARQPSIIRELTKLRMSAGPQMIFLAGGLPNPEAFPLKSASFELSDGKTIKLEGSEMHKALQYLPSNGLGDLISHIKTLQQHVHKPDEKIWSDADVIVTTGSQDALCKTFEMVFEEGDSVILENFVYPGVLAALKPMRLNYVIVQGDEYGMRPEDLREKLKAVKKKPKVLYVNPTGANPTGSVLTLERRKEIYNICQEHDILILEDDPYYFLQYGQERPQSLYSLDTDGRVIRYDSFSKILSSGLRLGTATGPKTLIERLALHVQVSSMHASSLSQVILNELFNSWGIDGFMSHVREIEDFYRQRRDALNEAAEKHLSNLCEWKVPEGGMFIWFKVKGMDDTWDLIMTQAIKANVSLVPGKAFSPDPSVPSPFLRAAFSVAPVEQMDEGCRKLATLIRNNI